MFCTDDREPNFIVQEGHINQMVRVAVEEGITPEVALVMATLHPAQYHRLWRHGAVAPGYQADLLVLDDLRSFRPRRVLKQGAEPEFPVIEVPEWVRQTVHVPEIDAPDFAVKASGRIRVIRVVPGQLLTGCEIKPGDLILGLASSGVHSNGFSLVRRIIEQQGWDLERTFPSLGRSLGAALLEPTRIYVRYLLPLVQERRLKGLAHITGGGLLENIPRVIPEGCHATVDADEWELPAKGG